MSGLLTTLGLAFGLAFTESGLGLGMLVPGETAVVVLAATVSSPAAIVALVAAVTCGACLGDHVGYLLGRRYGDRLRDSRVVAGVGRRHYDRAADLLRRQGGKAVLATRLLPIVRTLTPAAAGASGLAYRRFLPASLVGSALWASVYVAGGSVVGGAGAMLHDSLGRAAWLVIVVCAVAVLPVLLVSRVQGVRPISSAPTVETWEREARPAEPVLVR